MRNGSLIIPTSRSCVNAAQRSVCVCVRASARDVCALSPCLRGRVACEELDMSFRGIRHLKREQVKATELGIKHQPTSARKHQLGAPPDRVHLFYFPWIYHLALRVRRAEGAASVNLHLKWMRLNNQHYTGINQHPPLFWVSTFLSIFMLLFPVFLQRFPLFAEMHACNCIYY